MFGRAPLLPILGWPGRNSTPFRHLAAVHPNRGHTRRKTPLSPPSHRGPGQTVEQELALCPEGMGQLSAFLGLSFGGGSDPIAAMGRVPRLPEENGWRNADVLFAGDGEWPALPGLAVAMRKARGAGTRFHGVQVGNRGRTGLHQICEPVHPFTDWTKFSGADRSPAPHRSRRDRAQTIAHPCGALPVPVHCSGKCPLSRNGRSGRRRRRRAQPQRGSRTIDARLAARAQMRSGQQGFLRPKAARFIRTWHRLSMAHRPVNRVIPT